MIFILVLDREQMPSEPSLFATSYAGEKDVCQMAAARGSLAFYSPEI